MHGETRRKASLEKNYRVHLFSVFLRFSPFLRVKGNSVTTSLTKCREGFDMRKAIVTVLCAVTFVTGSPKLFAQMGVSNARSLAMGGAYLAVANGVEAPRWNPANLGLHNRPGFSMNLISFGAAFSNNSFSKNDYDLYNGAFLTPQMKSDILGKIPDEGLSFDVDTEVDALAFSWKNFALSISAESSAKMNLSRTFVDIALNGNQLDKVYDFSDSGGEAIAVSTVGLSYGRALYVPLFSDFAVGATFKYVIGLGHAEVIDAYGVMGTTFDGAYGDARAKVRHATGGRGVAADIGAAAMVSNKLTIGLTIRNFISSVKWNKEVKIQEYGVTADSLTVDSIDEFSADSLIDDYDLELDGDSFSKSLPAELRLGGAYRSGRLLLSADYVQGFKNRPGVSSKPQLALGAEFHLIGFLPLRAGIALGGSHGASSGAGFGLRIGTFEMNFAAGSWGAILPKSAGGIGVGFGIRVGI